MGSKRRVRREQAAFAYSQLGPHDSRVKRIKNLSSLSVFRRTKNIATLNKRPRTAGPFAFV